MTEPVLSFARALPFWPELPESARRRIREKTVEKQFSRGSRLYYGGGECAGLELVIEGQVRVLITSPSGGEITLYRLLPGDVCILSAACMIQSLDVEIQMEMERDSTIAILPSNVFDGLSQEYPVVKSYVLEMISSRFSDVMWTMNQLVFSNTGSRLAQALLERGRLAGSGGFDVTHDSLARDLGTAREVVTRLLKQFQSDGLVSLERGRITLRDPARLAKL